MTYYFIAGEPSSLMTMVNMAHVIKKLNADNVVEAIVPYHGFLARMDAQEFLDEFDKVWYLPICNFQRNIFLGYLRGRAFKRALERIVFKENSTAFAFISMEMSINLVIKHISEKCKSTKVILLSYFTKSFDVTGFGGKFSKLLSLFNRFYSFMFGCYPMKSYINNEGQLMYCEHSQKLSFPMILLTTNGGGDNVEQGSEKPGRVRLPYPTIVRNEGRSEKREKFVVFFGDAAIVDYYAQLDKQFLVNKTTQYVNAIRDYYSERNIKIYYKPHPYDGEKIMAGCESAGFLPFKERLNAEMLFSKYHNDIIAVYAISSHSAAFGSKYGVPAYWAFEICFNDEELKRSFRKFVLENNNDLLKNLSGLDQIGSIDKCKKKNDINQIITVWKKGLQTLDRL